MATGGELRVPETCTHSDLITSETLCRSKLHKPNATERPCLSYPSWCPSPRDPACHPTALAVSQRPYAIFGRKRYSNLPFHSEELQGRRRNFPFLRMGRLLGAQQCKSRLCCAALSCILRSACLLKHSWMRVWAPAYAQGTTPGTSTRPQTPDRIPPTSPYSNRCFAF